MWAQVLVTALAFKQSRVQQNLSDRNKTGLSRPNTWATATSKKIHDFGRVSFPSFPSRGYQGGSARRVLSLLVHVYYIYSNIPLWNSSCSFYFWKLRWAWLRNVNLRSAMHWINRCCAYECIRNTRSLPETKHGEHGGRFCTFPQTYNYDCVVERNVRTKLVYMFSIKFSPACNWELPL